VKRPEAIAGAIRALAEAEGFARVGFAAVEPLDEEAIWLGRWIDEGMHAGMGWMARSLDQRLAPGRLLPGAASVAVLAMPYAHALPPDPGGLSGRTSCYAWGRDYHNVAGKALRRIQRQLAERFPGLDSYASVDSRPVFERAWAVRAGLGWAGRSCCTILPGLGSKVFLATLTLREPLPPSPPLEASCGSCARCLRACPTGALRSPGRLDARRCLSYLTIEHRGAIPEELRPAMGRTVFGCDACQDTCPHAAAAGAQGHAAFAPRPDRAWLDLPALLREDDEALERKLEGSPLRRARATGLKRNAAVVLGNLGDPAALPALAVARRHPDPIVSEHAGWAAVRCAS
jgi:epoxyqueuosine reductase